MRATSLVFLSSSEIGYIGQIRIKKKKKLFLLEPHLLQKILGKVEQLITINVTNVWGPGIKPGSSP